MQSRFGDAGRKAEEPSSPLARSMNSSQSAGVSLPPIVLGPDNRAATLVTAHGRVIDFGAARPQRLAGGEWIKCSSLSILAGQVDAHSHAYQALMPFGLPQPDLVSTDYVRLQSETIWAMDRCLDRWSLEAAARLHVAEALLNGTTTLIDLHSSSSLIEGSLDLLADVCQELGMRALLAYGISERNGGREEAERGLLECRRFLLSNSRALVRGAVGIEGCYLVSDPTISDAVQLCQETGAALHIQLGEDFTDVRDAQNRGFEGPLERLHHLGALGPRTILAHANHLNSQQVQLVRDLGCWIVQAPRASERSRVGYCSDLSECQRVALGCDGFVSDLRQEASALAKLNRHSGDDRVVVSHRAQAGRTLAGELFETEFGLVPVGACDALCAGAEGIAHVLVGGRLVVRDGQLTTGNVGHMRADAVEMAARLKRKMVPESKYKRPTWRQR